MAPRNNKRRRSDRITVNVPTKRQRSVDNNLTPLDTANDHLSTKPPIPADIDIIVIPSRTPSPLPVASCQVHTEVEDVSSSAVSEDPVDTANESKGNSTSALQTGLPYDVCFGLLLLQINSMSHKEQIPPEGAPLQVSLIGDILSFQYEHTSKRAGFVASEALARLLRECSVTLSAVIGQSNTHRDSKSSTRFEWDIESHPLRILVYGVRSQKDTVTKILDGGSLFLQRPGVSGYDKRVEYFNPMYLLRAGERMPREAYFSRPEDRKLPGATAETQEHEIETGMALELFNEANGSNARVSSKLKQSPRLVSQLKEHQLTALSMMIEREEGPLEGKAMFPCLWEPSHEDGKILYRHVVTRAVQGLPLPNLHGGILADEMGLGKTLSVIALICYHLDQTSGPTSITQYPFSRTTLIVTPKSTIYGWQQQLERHVRFAGIRSFVYHGPRREDRSNQQNNLDVVITTYDTLRSDWKLDGFLYKHTWTRIILDEAHIIRNSSSEIFDAACQIRARNRWCLTGTPIQNSLNDYGSLLAFVGVPPFTTLAHFKYWISSRIHSNPDDHTLKLLRKLIGATSLRRTKSTPQLSESLRLPLKSEKIEMVEFSPSERQVYDFFKRRSYLLLSKSPSNDEAATSSDKKRRSRAKKKEKAVEKASRKRTGNIIVLISVLRMICNHAEMMLPKNALDAWQNRDFDSVSWASLQELAEEDRTCCVCGVALDIPERSYTETVKLACARHVACEACVVSAEADMTIALACPRCPPTKSPSATEIPISRPSFCMSSKLSSLVRNVLSSLEGTKTDVEASVHIKSVIFSQWTGMLDLVSKALSPRLASSGFTFIRIDGSSTLQQRRVALDKFNSDSNCVVMLATIGAVSEGIDLTAASETHILEPHWNPMAEAQAVDRVHRIGQTKDVTITRYYTKGSVEEYIRWVQMRKLKLIRQSLSPSNSVPGETQEEGLANECWERLLDYLK